MMQEGIQERIKELRKALGFNQTEFGEKIGAKQATVAGWEVGRREPSDLVLNSICKEFDVNESWLLEGIKPMFKLPSDLDNEVIDLTTDLIDTEDEFTKIVISKYLKLSPESKKAVKELILSIAEEYSGIKKDGSYKEPPFD